MNFPSDFFAQGVEFSTLSLGDRVDDLFQAELPGIAGACARRRLEFAAGRTCARRALGKLGVPVLPIPIGKDRRPQWPEGTIGSISHSREVCIAAVARKASGLAALGVDVEERDAVTLDLAEEICTPQERIRLFALPVVWQQPTLAAIFSAKESSYKAQYELTGKTFGFDAISILLSPQHDLFTAVFEQPIPPFVTGTRLTGKVHVSKHHIATAIAVAEPQRCNDNFTSCEKSFNSGNTE